MVLLNGVKYACERCIRGHRVSSCTHTDKPLTMIKPKGRPASQCLHCRELRKIKNTHSSCSCGKKGKSPGQHLASCLCHKNSHCTCPTREKKEPKSKLKSASESLSDNETKFKEGQEMNTSSSSNNADANYFIDDVVVPFGTNHGLLDFLHSNNDDSDISIGLSSVAHQLISEEGNRDEKQNSYGGLGRLPNPPSDADLDLMENMFPLFPLVGTSSFDDSKSLPLLPLPYNGDHDAGSGRIHHHAHKTSHISAPVSNGSNSGRDRLRQDVKSSQHNSSLSVPHHHSTFAPHGALHQQHSATSVSTTGTQTSNQPQHPKPLKASLSFNSNLPHSNPRPRRPESVMSLASTSSNASRTNLTEVSTTQQFGLPKLSSSAAFPPFQFSEKNSAEDLYQSYLDNCTIFNDQNVIGGQGDHDDFGRLKGVNGTPQSSIPSRQTLQLRRKTSVSRPQAHNPTLIKEHPLLPLRSASSAESSPSYSQHLCSPQSEHKNDISNFSQYPNQTNSNGIHNNFTSELSSNNNSNNHSNNATTINSSTNCDNMSNMNNVNNINALGFEAGTWPQVSKKNAEGPAFNDVTNKQISENPQEFGSEDAIYESRYSDLIDYQDLSMIPMFQELVNPVKHES